MDQKADKRVLGTDLDITTNWQKIQDYLEKPVNWILNIIMILVISLIILDNIISGLYWKFFPETNRTDTLLGILIFLIAAILKHLHKRSAWMNSQSALINQRFISLNRSIKSPPLRSFPTERKAYAELIGISKGKDIHRADLLQFSGQTAVTLMEQILDSREHIKIRLLLFHPSAAYVYDRNREKDYHKKRINATLSEIKTFSKLGQIDVRFYKCEPSICSVLLDGDIAAYGWYRRYLLKHEKTGKIHTVLSSHDGHTIVDDGAESSLRNFMKDHFEAMWLFSEPASS